jgi:moderate conductance mechanosensitive channel
MIKRCQLILFCCLVFSLSLISQTHNLAAEPIPAEATALEGLPPAQVDSILAKMSDEQVRSLLVSELNSKVDTTTAPPKTNGLVGKTARWLHLLDEAENKKENASGFLSRINRMPVDYIAVARNVGHGSLGQFTLTIIMIFAVFGAAWILEFFVRRFTANFRKQFQEKAIPVLDGPMRFIAGMMLAIPSVIHILVFTASAILFFYLLPSSDYSPVRFVFLAILFVIIFHRLLSQLSQIFCSPQSAALRVLPLEDTVAETIHKAVMILCTYTFTAVMFIALQRELQLNQTTAHTTAMIVATFLIMLIMSMVKRSRTYVRDHILEKSELNKTRNWVVEQFAQFWHVPAILYFLIIWLIMIGEQLTGVQRGNSAFLMSLLILPLFVFFNGLGQWVVRGSINTLQIYNHDEDESADEETKERLFQAKEKERKLYITTSRIMSLAILATLLVWVLSLWGVNIPYASNITAAVFESLITLALALTVWRFASSYIERKIAESTSEEEGEEDKSDDDEMGGATARGRSYTLLPMLRKFVATTLVVMVTLVILSSIGLNIGPLLAGAGVVGLAVGFGAQKLVSDVFSGFFYLFDDAFRVGEYIQTKSVSGAVESITLRNVMLRHHRGMLQIVPHSDLGSITNFMRGGIIVKFNLEFPYDANVDKIRKVIKKVGQAMLKDEEFGDDFITPVKSGGVREITASVMVIRVKFKAKSGTQFVIRREAYRRISEALAAQGIHYAHRKIIVELPEQEKKTLTEENLKLLEAGAAAGIVQQEEDDKKKAESLLE